MHVGSGEVNYGVIDNLIQRDPVTSLPGINSSGLKGGIREFFRAKNALVKEVFGSEPKDDFNKTRPGKARFFEANLLSLPVRSDKTPYIMATSVSVINELIDKLELFDCVGREGFVTALKSLINHKELQDLNQNDTTKAIVFDRKLEGACIEDADVKAVFKNITITSIVEELLGTRLAILSDKFFTTLCDDNHLPVMARNNLNDGVSANLWYEQILPRYTRLYFMLMDSGIDSTITKDFYSALSSKIFQIGANASIGYGFCRFIELLIPQKK